MVLHGKSLEDISWTTCIRFQTYAQDNVRERCRCCTRSRLSAKIASPRLDWDVEVESLHNHEEESGPFEEESRVAFLISDPQAEWNLASAASAIISDLATNGFAIVDDFLPMEAVFDIKEAAVKLDARDSRSASFLSLEAIGLLEGRMPAGFVAEKNFPSSLFGPPGPAPINQPSSCLQRDANSQVRRSWLQTEHDELSGAFRCVTTAFDSILALLRAEAGDNSMLAAGRKLDINLRDARKLLQSADFRDHVMVARHSGLPCIEPLHLEYDTDKVLRTRHGDWQGDCILIAVLFLDGGGSVRLSSQKDDFQIACKPNRAFLYWPKPERKYYISESPSRSFAVVIRFFDGRRSFNTPPGLEHLYRHCNPVGTLDRLDALQKCAHNHSHAKKIELIHKFFEVEHGNKFEPAQLERWLGENGYCAQCGCISKADCSPSAEYGGKWACRSCVVIWNQAACLEVRPVDGAGYSSLSVSDEIRELVRNSIREVDGWIFSLRSGALTPPETIQGMPCPISALGECGDTTCALYRFATPGARSSFLKIVTNHVSLGVSCAAGKRSVVSFIGCGQLYFEYLLLDQIICNGTKILDVHLVDTAYGVPSKWTAERYPMVAERAALAQFIAWFTQSRVFVHTSIEEWQKRTRTSHTGTSHAVVMVDVAPLLGEWDSRIRPLLEASLPRGSLFAHLTQGRDDEAVKGRDGIEAPRFVWAEIHQLRLIEGRLTFQRLERHDWELGTEGSGICTA